MCVLGCMGGLVVEGVKTESEKWERGMGWSIGGKEGKAGTGGVQKCVWVLGRGWVVWWW